MGKRGVWGDAALPEDAKGPRGGDTSVRVRVWEEPETLQGMDEPRSEEDIPPDPPYGQSVNVRDVQERTPTHGGHVPQERIKAEASKGGGTDDTGGKKQGAVEDVNAHTGGAEASMGEHERRSGESEEPEWMRHMRRRMNVMYEGPEGIIEGTNTLEDGAESLAGAGMATVAVAVHIEIEALGLVRFPKTQNCIWASPMPDASEKSDKGLDDEEEKIKVSEVGRPAGRYIQLKLKKP